MKVRGVRAARPSVRPRVLGGASCALALVLGSMPTSGSQFASRPPDIGFEPTSMEVADAMLKLAGVGPGDVVYDLGSGDGRIVILAAEKYGARGVGVELEPYLVQRARDAAQKANVAGKVTFIEGDLFAADVSAATVVTLYLKPSVNDRLKWKLRRELRPGTRIVSHSFGIGNWPPERTVQVENSRTLLMWTVPRGPSRVPDVEFDPTLQTVVEEMLQLAGVGPGDMVYDLGSGDGRVVVLAAQNHRARGVGIEIDPRLVDIARQVAEEAQVSHAVRFVEGDLFTADLSAATVVTLALSPEINTRLEPKLRKELRPGTRIVSHAHGIGSWMPEKAVRAHDGKPLFLWVVRR
jgi:cyclopropane fatty-acyl-phospholipid synthase-like methyltransferase